MSNQIILFQQRVGLPAAGVIGKRTLAALKSELKIKTDNHLAHFVGQTGHESLSFTKAEESLYYKDPLDVVRIFRTKFDLDKDKKVDPEEIEFAKLYLRNSVKMANYVYANRMGNGSEASGDGYRYRARGATGLTGKDNYRLFSNHIGEDCVKNPDLVATKYFFESAVWFFNANKLWKYCDIVDATHILILSRAINLGDPNSKGTPEGLKDRVQRTNKINLILTAA